MDKIHNNRGLTSTAKWLIGISLVIVGTVIIPAISFMYGQKTTEQTDAVKLITEIGNKGLSRDSMIILQLSSIKDTLRNLNNTLKIHSIKNENDFSTTKKCLLILSGQLNKKADETLKILLYDNIMRNATSVNTDKNDNNGSNNIIFTKAETTDTITKKKVCAAFPKF